MSEKIKIVAACGVGMGSSLILKMTIEDIVRELGINASVEHADIGSVKSANPDIVVVQTFHEEKVKDAAKVVVAIDDFFNKDKLREKLIAAVNELKGM
ncbi:Ascorbate-specific phosphotransferase enzyme IIB component [Fervidicola ferrireducens]|uniref:Ascorbate-specific phosphotransferase enzyme IIB component n=1 Tax=Fervidicola ferrireducens TaxID=520764 RepID=A0A140LE09_9FIRM|nr:PTS sugar transporter subunit IIB [Fervidicola ferrireducens]KXG78784.1 Ascorbate-specific phosphotransferase enzyme IIB component [Fervidicola ferrireducens]